MAVYGTVVLAGYAIAVETHRLLEAAWQRLGGEARRLHLARAFRHWTARPLLFSLYLVTSHLVLFFLGSYFGLPGVIVGALLVVGSFLLGPIVSVRLKP